MPSFAPQCHILFLTVRWVVRMSSAFAPHHLRPCPTTVYVSFALPFYPSPDEESTWEASNRSCNYTWGPMKAPRGSFCRCTYKAIMPPRNGPRPPFPKLAQASLSIPTMQNSSISQTDGQKKTSYKPCALWYSSTPSVIHNAPHSHLVCTVHRSPFPFWLLLLMESAKEKKVCGIWGRMNEIQIHQ